MKFLDKTHQLSQISREHHHNREKKISMLLNGTSKETLTVQSVQIKYLWRRFVFSRHYIYEWVTFFPIQPVTPFFTWNRDLKPQIVKCYGINQKASEIFLDMIKTLKRLQKVWYDADYLFQLAWKHNLKQVEHSK